MPVTHTRRILGNMQHLVANGLEWLLASHGEFQHAIPVSLAIPLRRWGAPRSRIVGTSGPREISLVSYR